MVFESRQIAAYLCPGRKIKNGFKQSGQLIAYLLVVGSFDKDPYFIIFLQSKGNDTEYIVRLGFQTVRFDNDFTGISGKFFSDHTGWPHMYTGGVTYDGSSLRHRFYQTTSRK